MAEETVIKHCSPTLAGIKTGNLFSYPYQDDVILDGEVTSWNRRLNSKGVYLLILRKREQRALVYVYRKQKLEQVLQNREVQDFLQENGYRTETVAECFRCLARRLQRVEGFPHEIGVFLDYPLPDIRAFIRNKGHNCSCEGCWKAYTNLEEARRTFETYRRCTEFFRRRQKEGVDLLQLTAAV